MSDNKPQIVLGQMMIDAIKDAVKEAMREAMSLGVTAAKQPESDKSFLTVKRAAEISGLGASTIRLGIRRRQLRAQKVGRRVLIKRIDLESFLEANPIEATND